LWHGAAQNKAAGRQAGLCMRSGLRSQQLIDLALTAPAIAIRNPAAIY
jgi:hypothetical protein